MQLCAVVTREDLVGLIKEITPLRVELSHRPRRVISFGRPTGFELVAGAGLRLRGDARFTWDIAGLSLPVTLQTFQILLSPSVVVRGGAHVLAFDPILEVLDFKRVPMFLDDKIHEAINQGLASQRHKLAWNFTEALGVSRALPAKVQPAARFELSPTAGKVTVTADALRLDLDFAAHFERATDVLPISSRRMIDDVPPSSRASAR